MQPNFLDRHGRTRAHRLAIVLAACALAMVTGGGCERPPVAPPGDDEPAPAGRAFLDLAAFVQDRHAIEGKWYEYDNTTHTQNPRPQVWIVRDASAGPARFGAFHIKSIYENTESGRFTLGVATWDGAGWSPESEWVSPRNQKLTGRLCADLWSGDEVSCSEDGWQLRFEYFKYFAPLSLFSVDNPGVFARSVAGTDAFGAVTLARLDDVEDLAALPDPTNIEVLDDGPGTRWDSSEWAYQDFAANLPEAGMAIGRRFVDDGFIGRDDVYFLLGGRLELVRMQLRPTVDGEDAALTITWSETEVSFDDGSFSKTLSSAETAEVDVPDEGGITFLHFGTEGLVVSDADLDGAAWPHEPPPTRTWHLAVTRTGGVVRVLVSPSAAVVNATQRGLDEALPPIAPE